MQNFFLELIENFSGYGDEVAIKSNTKTIRYNELASLIDFYARQLTDYGVCSGDVVALTLSDEFELAITSFALGTLHATSICLPRSLTDEQRKDCLNKSGAIFVVFHSSVDDEINQRVTLKVGMIKPRELGFLNQQYAQGELMRIALGSGSTGTRKLIPITHCLMSQRMQIYDRSIPRPLKSNCASCVHIEYGLGYFRLLASLYRGLTHIFINSSGVNLIEAIDKASINQLSLTVFHLQTLLDAKSRAKTFSANSLESLIVGSSIVPQRLRKSVMEAFGDILTITYGTNETLFLTVLNPGMAPTAENSVGWPAHNVKIEIVDRDNGPLNCGQLGRIRVRSTGLVSEYLNSHPDNLRFFHDGWFYPGDLGRLENTGELLFCGRSDGMMVRNGINIYPAEIESCLINFPGVEDVVVIPLMHDVSQDLPVAFVATKTLDKSFHSKLSFYAKEKLGFRAPFKIFLLEKLPRNEGGKIPKEVLQQLVEKLYRAGKAA
jgi:cyanophycin synthetase